MPKKYYLPAFLGHCKELQGFLNRNQKNMVQLNAITSPQLDHLNALATDLNTILQDPAWGSYTESP